MVKEEGEASIARRTSMSLQFLLLFLLLSLSSRAQGDISSDAVALLNFKNNLTIGSSGSRAQLATWNTSSIPTICSSWVGVVCSSVSNQQRVSELHLPGKSLYGHISADTLGRLDALDTLSLRSNKLSGGLPPDLANLSSLGKLFLQNNVLSGPLPSDFSSWLFLSQLDLSFNSFSGAIPASLVSLTRLKSLSLQNNLLNGTIPPFKNASLVVFNVSNNELNGSVPASLSGFPPSSFAGNANLCGLPLAACVGTPPQSLQSKSKKLSAGAKVGIACGAAAAALILLLLLMLCFFLVCKKRKGVNATESRISEGNRGLPSVAVTSNEVKWEESAVSAKEGEERNKLVFLDEKRLFDLEDLLRASAEVLGKGTLGTAYKAVLEDGLIVTVKRLRDIDESHREEHRERIHAIGSLRHDNLVPLRAYYFHKEENLLVYDFMQNGSLSALLHGNRGGGYNALDWEARVRIAATSARGLAYLHAHSMVHGNVKSSNVLLKSNLDACLADYGLSQMVPFTPGAHVPAIGYLAPEITDPRNISPLADVFSFGVLLLELLTGKVPSSSTPSSSSAPGGGSSVSPSGARTDDPVDLPRWVQSVVREEWTAEVFDPLLIQSGQSFNEEEMVQLLQVAMPCVAPSPDQRPSMADVVRMIDNVRRTSDDDKSFDSYTASISGGNP